MKHIFLSIVAAATLSMGLVGCCNATQEPEALTNDEVILHAWSWSFNTIADNMKLIADAGYDMVQTSPAQTCFVGEDGGMALFSQEGDSVRGKWYYYYQPIDWKIGNYMLGTRDEFKAMCDSAHKYNVRVLVDVLPNHVAIDHTAVTAALDSVVGGHENLFHANGFTDITQWNDRLECTTGMMGKLPDVNTENPDFQYYYMKYINDLIACGARGFRYDTAKHIGLPSDPTDAKSERNNFWDVATGREAIKDITLALPDSLYFYGEVLQDRNVKETEYAEYMNLTASSYGGALRNALNHHSYHADNLAEWHHPVAADKLVTWVESHDTYCNAHESAGMSDALVRQGYVFLTARQHGTPLFYSRPAGSTRENYWGNNRIGERGNDEFFHPEVVAAIAFRKAMSGCAEQLVASDNGAVVEVARGSKGAALINISEEAQAISIKTSLPAGEYTDNVHNVTFNVADSLITGELAPLSSYILY